MQKLSVEDILNATGGSLICGSADAVITDITTDSRKATSGTLFVPICGEHNDGHDFIENAFENGSDTVITHKDIEKHSGKNIIRVKDTRLAIGDIARLYLEKYRIPVVAVTGSVGKTSTKDMIASVLSMKYNTIKTQGNFNNDLGLPLTVFNIEKEHEAAVLEMGMSHMGEINYLASVAKPDAAVITNIGMSHIENLGSQENIYISKMQVCDYFNKDSLLVVNGDDKFLSRKNDRFRTLTCGIDNKNCGLVAENIENLGIDGAKFDVKINDVTYRFRTKAPGTHNVYNALCAIAIGLKFEIPIDKIIEGIENAGRTNMRLEIKNFGGLVVIDDCYNASPDSIRAALKVLSSVNAKRKIAVLGDVFEMGGFAEKELYEIGTDISDLDMLVTVGNVAGYIAKGAEFSGFTNVKKFKEVPDAIEFLTAYVKEGDTILVKASRGMRFERIVNALEQI